MRGVSSTIPYVFLDVDGVCTACDATPGSYITNRGAGYGPSKRCTDMLVGLLEETGATVIISSNWRRFEPDGVWRTSRFGDVKNPLPKLRAVLGDRISGSLPAVRHITKAEALRMWFDENGVDPVSCRYVVFDDDPSEGFAESEFSSHFVMTDYSVGLSEKDCKKAKEILLS